MANDISRVDNTKPINNNRAVCSTTFTGYSSKLDNKLGIPGDLTITNIEDKFDNRFINGILVVLSNGMIDGGSA